MLSNKLLFVMLLCISNQSSIIAQSFHGPVSYVGISPGAYAGSQCDVFSFTANQGALAGMKYLSAAVYGEQRFMLQANRYCAAAIAAPFRAGGIGMVLDYGGNRNYNESSIGLAYGKKLGPVVDVGLQFNYFMIHIAGYRNTAAINAAGGLLLHFNDKLQGGIQVTNLMPGSFSKRPEEKLKRVYKMGLGYESSDLFFAGANLVKEEDRTVNVELVARYHFMDRFFLQTGFVSGIAVFVFSAGTTVNKFRLLVSVSHHPQLGITPGILLAADFKGDDQ